MTTPSLQESFPVPLGDKTYRFIPTMKFVFCMGELEDLMGGDDRSAAAGMRGMDLLLDCFKVATRRDHDWDDISDDVLSYTFNELVDAIRNAMAEKAGENLVASPPDA